MPNFSVVITTYKRPQDLSECITSVAEQSVLPTEVLVIDDDVLSSKFLDKQKQLLARKNIILRYLKKNQPGLSLSKNLGVRKANEEIVFIFDDDLVLLPDFFANIMSVWEDNWSDEKLAGVGGLIDNARPIGILEHFYNRIFGLSSDLDWDITSTGFQVWDPGIVEASKGHYMHGGVSSYRKSVASQFEFEQWNPGRTALEDVDMALKMKQAGYYYIMQPSARVYHKESSEGKEDLYKTGFKEGLHRKIIFQKRCPQDISNKIKFVWANVGWILRQILTGHFVKAWAMLRGVLKTNLSI